MHVNRCISCMGETKTYPCPHCGFDPAKQEQLSYALPANSILNGRYLVGRVLGQGGFGITYVGWDLALEVKVAIKEFYPSGQVNRYPGTGSTLLWNSSAQTQAFRKTGVESFLKEARKMAKVDGIPEVVRVRDTFQENDTAYIVMDFVEGETLKDRLKRTGPMAWGKAKAIFLPAISAMSQVHKAGLIHRDISPDNLMLEPGGSVRILDLGAAKDLSAGSGASSMLVTKGGFSPLEQYGQRGGSGPWTDVYAMAATIYYTLTGIVPPTAVDRLDEDTLRWDLPQLRSLPVNVLIALQQAMVVPAKNRTQSMDALLSALQGRSGNTGKETGQSGRDGKKEEKETPKNEHKVENEQARKKQKKRNIIAAAIVLICIVCGIYLQAGLKNPEPAKDTAKDASLSHTHTWVAATCTTAKKCSTCGATEGAPLGHTWKEATCTEPEVCTRCGAIGDASAGHSWVSATCTDAKYCSVCGITEGEPLGHTWKEATCTEPETCTRCGATGKAALGHDWIAATTTKPKTCSRCGATEGNIKGYYESVDGSWSETRVNVGPATLYPYLLDEPVYRCTSFTLLLKLTDATGWYQGGWRLSLRDSNGNWQDLKGFTVEADSVGKIYEFEFTFDPAVTFDAVAVYPANLTGCSWSNAIAITEVYTKED